MIVLASASPRRKELLAGLDLTFEVKPTFADEQLQDGEAPREQARRLALQKAVACRRPPNATLLIGADTLVVLEGRILGKPVDAVDADAMLWDLRGREHHVLTGLALVDVRTERVLAQVADTPVQMRAYSAAEADAYVATDDPMDKAGAYAIQHPEFSPVESLGDCYANVVGLPLCHLVRALRCLGVEPPRHPLEGCPYALSHSGCAWSEAILEEPCERWCSWVPLR